jgi:hypothetical protein
LNQTLRSILQFAGRAVSESSAPGQNHHVKEFHMHRGFYLAVAGLAVAGSSVGILGPSPARADSACTPLGTGQNLCAGSYSYSQPGWTDFGVFAAVGTPPSYPDATGLDIHCNSIGGVDYLGLVGAANGQDFLLQDLPLGTSGLCP